jgi:hypothetical chaperone protein
MQTSAGLDFGTSNCALGIMQGAKPQLVELPEHGFYMPSTLFAPQPEMIGGWLYTQLEGKGLGEAYRQARPNKLNASLRAMAELKLDGYGDELAFGKAALKEYLVDPADCYYVKSPKSFLGASGLRDAQQQQFEDIAASMMWHLKIQSEKAGVGSIDKVVIGRPVNFQGLDSELSNQQAVQILTNAALFVGFGQVEFLFEPMAAGLAYQQSLTREQQVLVVDIGGGTSDVSMVTMGPGYLDSHDHQSLVLGYSGERIGGNDFDITLNFETLMPTLGARLTRVGGQPMPIKPFWDAAAINDLPAQSRFYGKDTLALLARLVKEPGMATLARMAKLSRERLTYQLSAFAEMAKIELSQSPSATVDLSCLEGALEVDVTAEQFSQASARLLEKIGQLVDSVVAQAGCQPDALFLTGGSANSPMVRAYLQQRYAAPLVSGDNFGSVTTGLTLWAHRIFN